MLMMVKTIDKGYESLDMIRYNTVILDPINNIFNNIFNQISLRLQNGDFKCILWTEELNIRDRQCLKSILNW